MPIHEMAAATVKVSFTRGPFQHSRHRRRRRRPHTRDRGSWSCRWDDGKGMVGRGSWATIKCAPCHARSVRRSRKCLLSRLLCYGLRRDERGGEGRKGRSCGGRGTQICIFSTFKPRARSRCLCTLCSRILCISQNVISEYQGIMEFEAPSHISMYMFHVHGSTRVKLVFCPSYRFF